MEGGPSRRGDELLVLNTFVEPRMGGPQHRALRVASRLRDRGVDTVFLVPEGDDGFVDAARDAGFACRRVPFSRIRRPRYVTENLRFLAGLPRTVSAIGDVIADVKPDLIHASMSTDLQTAAAARRSDIPLVWHLNATVVPRPFSIGLGRLAGRWSDEVIVSSGAVATHYGLDGATTVYPPVDLETFDPETVAVDETRLREEIGVPLDIPLVGAVGNPTPVKGFDLLIRAVESVVEAHGAIAVAVVGAELDSRQDYVERLRVLRDEAGLEDTVTFVGWRSDVPDLMALFDLFVCPSRRESGPMVVLEAMAMGCPVVTTEVGLVPEQFEDGVHARIVPPGDTAALARAMTAGLQAPDEQRKMAQTARTAVEDRLSASAAAERHGDVYRSALKDG